MLLTFSRVVRAVLALLSVASAFNNPPGVEVWCGKAYRPTNESFEPGGWLDEPPLSATPLLDLRIRPRMNLYLASDNYASFIVDASISYFVGESYYNTTMQPNSNVTAPFNKLFIEIIEDDSGIVLSNFQNVSVNSTSNEIVVGLARLPPQLAPYNITITGGSQDGAQLYTAKTQLHRLPNRNDTGSVVKLDNLYGGLLVQNYTANATTWSPLFPYSFYVSWDGYLNESLSQLDSFKAKGYNIIHVVPNAGLADQSFPWDQFNAYLDRADEIGLWMMYDMRWTYKNLTSVISQVNRLKTHPSLLLWYTGDEPDGQTDPLNATTNAYSLIKSLDPYHPISLCLNCYNFHYSVYAAGADIILSDVYPIAVNTSYSTQYDTPCNTTYGCCGCDDCEGNFDDISTRLDRFADYDTWLGSDWAPKTKWGVPMAFGNETFWSRYPTADEEVVMNVLSVNHNAKAVVMWAYPTTDVLADVTSRLAKVLTRDDVAGLVLGAEVQAVEVAGQKRVDAAIWTVGNKTLLSVVNLKYEGSEESVRLTLPVAVKGVRETLWGNGTWVVNGSTVTKNGLSGLEVALLVLDT